MTEPTNNEIRLQSMLDDEYRRNGELRAQLAHLRARLDTVIAIQCSHGNWNCNPYMHGLANGLLLAKANLTDSDYVPLAAPEVWLDSLSKCVCRYCRKPLHKVNDDWRDAEWLTWCSQDRRHEPEPVKAIVGSTPSGEPSEHYKAFAATQQVRMVRK